MREELFAFKSGPLPFDTNRIYSDIQKLILPFSFELFLKDHTFWNLAVAAIILRDLAVLSTCEVKSFKGSYDWRDPVFISMIMGGKVKTLEHVHQQVIHPGHEWQYRWGRDSKGKGLEIREQKAEGNGQTWLQHGGLSCGMICYMLYNLIYDLY